MGDTDLVPFDQGTFGSRTTPAMIPQIRRAAASAREALIDLAAAKFGLDRATLKAENGKVSGGSFVAGYGDLAKEQKLDKPIGQVPLTLVGDWKTLGKSIPKVGARDIVTGSHRYSVDQQRPGMLHAKVLRAPSIGATLVSADTSEAEKMPGVKVVKDGGFVAVAAPTLRQAESALLSVKAEWKDGPKASASDLPKVLRGEGVVPAGNAFGQTYSCAYIAHVPLEPRAALAEWDGKKMTVQTGTQRPFGVKGELVQALGLTEAQVRVIVPDTGSGYGGKHTGDAAVEAARIAKATGVPIRLVWTREEEFGFAYFRPAGIADVAAVVGTDGALQEWEFHNYNSGGSGLETPYEVAKKEQRYHRSESPLRQGSYRGLAAAFNHFARESAMDELAESLKMDTLEIRLKNLRNERMIEVLKTCAEKFGWPTWKQASGRGIGIACGTEKGSYIANAVELEVKGSEVRLIRIVTVFECGAILNPALLQQQVDGSVIMGIGGALFEAIDFLDGRLVTDRLSRYRVPRFGDVPAMETVLLDRKELPSAGAGETAIVTIAPAIGNAIFRATGKRLRSMPMRLD
jgi:isoquinoline 1-oxidoreductase